MVKNGCICFASIPENSACVPIKKDCDLLEDGLSSQPSSGSQSRRLGSDSSPYRSISAGEESDSEGEDENMKPRGNKAFVKSKVYHRP